LNGKSLLAVGITHVEGHFNKGDVVTLKDRHHQGIGVGVTRYAALDIARIQGLRSQEISNVLKYCSGQPVIHRNDLVIEKEKPNTK
jgi:glutamate 5-kinase